jgi:hypothetical protein
MNGNTKDTSLPGTTISNATFSNFGSLSSCPGHAIGVSGLAQQKSINSKISLLALPFEAGSDMKINFCPATYAEIVDRLITDSGSVNPSGDGTSGFIYSPNVSVFRRT